MASAPAPASASDLQSRGHGNLGCLGGFPDCQAPTVDASGTATRNVFSDGKPALEDTPHTVAELAGLPRQSRVLRLLATHGVFPARGDRFAHTTASRLLRGDHPTP